jgi:hypothetical protein
VAVTRGLVEVSDLASGEVADIGPDQRAAVDGPNVRIATIGGAIPVIQGSPRAPLVQPLTADGLVTLQDGSQSPGPVNVPGKPGLTVASARDGLVAASAVAAGDRGGGGGSGGVGGGPSTGFRSQSGSRGGAAANDDLGGSPTLLLGLGVALTALLAFFFAFLRARLG